MQVSYINKKKEIFKGNYPCLLLNYIDIFSKEYWVILGYQNSQSIYDISTRNIIKADLDITYIPYMSKETEHTGPEIINMLDFFLRKMPHC